MDNPGFVRMKRWCTRPYSSSADDSTIETSGILDESSSACQRLRRTKELTRFDVQNHFQRLLPERHEGLQTCWRKRTALGQFVQSSQSPTSEVEVVLDEVLMDLTEVIMAWNVGREPRLRVSSASRYETHDPGKRVGLL